VASFSTARSSALQIDGSLGLRDEGTLGISQDLMFPCSTRCVAAALPQHSGFDLRLPQLGLVERGPASAHSERSDGSIRTNDVTAAVRDVMARCAIGFDAVKHLLVGSSAGRHGLPRRMQSPAS
jgi:hypothetical protein